jgi:hypothetical protein
MPVTVPISSHDAECRSVVLEASLVASSNSVVVSAEEWERKTKRMGTLAKFFASSPLRASGLKVSSANLPRLMRRSATFRDSFVSLRAIR